MTDPERRKRMGDVLGAIGKACTFPKVDGAGMAGRAAMMHLVHLRDLYNAAVPLLGREQVHATFVLGRSMFETSVTLGALEKPETRDSVVLRWIHDSNRDYRRLVASFERVLGPDEVFYDVLKENDRKMTAAREEMGLHTARLPASLVIENEATKQGREEDIPNYLTAHGFTHGSYAALRYRVTHNEVRSTFRDTLPDVEIQEMAANFVGRSVLLGFRSGYRIFEVDEPDSVASLLDEIEFPEVEAVE